MIFRSSRLASRIASRRLDAYLERIGYTGPLEPSAEALHLAHLYTVPFGNPNIYLGRPIVLD